MEFRCSTRSPCSMEPSKTVGESADALHRETLKLSLLAQMLMERRWSKRQQPTRSLQRHSWNNSSQQHAAADTGFKGGGGLGLGGSNPPPSPSKLETSLGFGFAPSPSSSPT